MAAMALMAKWLKELILRTEHGIEVLGLVIEKKYMAKHEDGIVEPAITVKSSKKKWTVELFLGNTLAEFLTLDRSANPQKLDPRVLIDSFAEHKLNDLVKSRLAILEAMVFSKSVKEVRKKMENIAPGYAHIRMWEPLDGGKGGRKGKK